MTFSIRAKPGKRPERQLEYDEPVACRRATSSRRGDPHAPGRKLTKRLDGQRGELLKLNAEVLHFIEALSLASGAGIVAVLSA